MVTGAGRDIGSVRGGMPVSAPKTNAAKKAATKNPTTFFLKNFVTAHLPYSGYGIMPGLSSKKRIFLEFLFDKHFGGLGGTIIGPRVCPLGHVQDQYQGSP